MSVANMNITIWVIWGAQDFREVLVEVQNFFLVSYLSHYFSHTPLPLQLHL